MYGGSQYSLSAVLVSVLPAFSALIPGGLAASLTNQGEVLGDRPKDLRRLKGAFPDLQRKNIPFDIGDRSVIQHGKKTRCRQIALVMNNPDWSLIPTFYSRYTFNSSDDA